MDEWVLWMSGCCGWVGVVDGWMGVGSVFGVWVLNEHVF